MNGSMCKKFKCFIFSDDVEQSQYFLSNTNMKFFCKEISISIEPYNLRNELKENYNVHFTRMEFLDKNKVLIMADNFREITLPDIEVHDKEVSAVFKNQLLVLATSKVFSLNHEIGKASKLTSKVREKMRVRDRLQLIIEENLFNLK